MSHNDIYAKFQAFFPVQAKDVTIWFPNGKNSVRVRLFSQFGLEFIFTYHSTKDWKFETLDSFLSKVGGLACQSSK